MSDKVCLTIMGSQVVEFVEKHSKFIGHIFYIKTLEDAKMHIESVKNKHNLAAHNVPAYLIRSSGVMYCSDDGEPYGTAGRPILNILVKNRITNVCVVVTRYFGGVLLGTGGLVFAYSTTCKMLLEKVEFARYCICVPLDLSVSYGGYFKVERVLKVRKVRVVDKVFANCVELKLLVEKELEECLENELKMVTNADVIIKKKSEVWGRVEL